MSFLRPALRFSTLCKSIFSFNSQDDIVAMMSLSSSPADSEKAFLRRRPRQPDNVNAICDRLHKNQVPQLFSIVLVLLFVCPMFYILAFHNGARGDDFPRAVDANAE